MIRSIINASLVFLSIVVLASATPLVWDGRVRLNTTNEDLAKGDVPFFTGVKGGENVTHYSKFLRLAHPPTALWNDFIVLPSEQTISMTIDNTSIFIPGGTPPQPQFGFRRGEFIAQPLGGDHNTLNAESEVNTTVYHFSIQLDPSRPLNYSHEYQIVWIEPNDGTHVFDIQTGSPFTDPTGPLPVSDAHFLRVRDHALNVLFSTPFTLSTWHNFAVQVDWNALTLGVFYSSDGAQLRPVTGLEANPTTPVGAAGQGDFHFGVLKLPLVDPTENATQQGDVVHFGIQEGTTEGLFYSGVFIEKIANGVSAGGESVISSITK